MNPLFYPLSMVILWPLPWLLSSRKGRSTIGFKGPVSWHWFLTGLIIALAALAVIAGSAWIAFGDSNSNWLVRHARSLEESLSTLPKNAASYTRFWAATLPAMIFSPIGEEFLYRGFMLGDFTKRWGFTVAMVLQALAFAVVHLAHYGLNPLQPALIMVFVPSMFVAALIFGWIRHKSRSIWVAVWSHSVFNLGMNGIAFWYY